VTSEKESLLSNMSDSRRDVESRSKNSISDSIVNATAQAAAPRVVYTQNPNPTSEGNPASFSNIGLSADQTRSEIEKSMKTHRDRLDAARMESESGRSAHIFVDDDRNL